MACSSLGQSHSLAKQSSGVGRVKSLWLLDAGRKLFYFPWPESQYQARNQCNFRMENVVIRMCDVFVLPDAAVERGPPSGLRQGGEFADLVCLCVSVAKIREQLTQPSLFCGCSWKQALAIFKPLNRFSFSPLYFQLLTSPNPHEDKDSFKNLPVSPRSTSCWIQPNKSTFMRSKGNIYWIKS